ncbi:hypothetical protein [Prochlorococcus sp. MIT 1303]|uniref:hypothetical protein n=1 Tax=Prochlorococcus sp. MIT 1303 TaxID=1723647 RepID=UPI0007B37466|nr:hypothetical protein [Prochlorococcus sp. MIT 1303]KZR67930.1 hypothetical protein PMIT1303_00258 [Prochlorococcus sp. MIT 1303]
MPASISSAAIHVIGTDAAGLDHLASPLQELVLSAQGFKLDPRFNKDLKADKPKRAMGQEKMRPACQQISRPARGSRHRLNLDGITTVSTAQM